LLIAILDLSYCTPFGLLDSARIILLRCRAFDFFEARVALFLFGKQPRKLEANTEGFFVSTGKQ